MRIIRKLLAAGQVYPENIRYNEGTDTVQFSPDDGTTWVDSPQNDPRQTTHYPPPDTADPRCDAAARMSALLQEQEAFHESQLQAGAFGAEVATLILLLLAFIPLIGVLTAVIIGAYLQLVTFGYAAVHAAFDGFDWSALTCTLYCHIETDGRMTASTYAAFLDDLDADYTANQAFVIHRILDYLGYGGLNDTASVRAESGDCDGCNTCGWCWQNDWAANLDDFFRARVNPTGGSLMSQYVGASGWQGVVSNSLWQNQIRYAFPSARTISYVSVETASMASVRLFAYTNDSDAGITQIAVMTNEGSGVFSWSGSQSVNGVMLVADNAPASAQGTVFVTGEFHGFGDNPFGEDNC